MSAQDQLEIIGPGGQIAFCWLDPARGITNIGRHPENDIVIDSPDVAPFHALLDHRQKPFQLTLLASQGHTAVSGQSLEPNTPRALSNWDAIELNGHSLILMEGAAGALPSQPPPSRVHISGPGVSGPLPPRPEPAAFPAAPAAVELAPLAPAAALPAAAAAPEAEQKVPAAPAVDEAELEHLDEVLAEILEELPEDRQDEVIVVEVAALNFAIDPSVPTSLDFAVEVEQTASFQATIVNGGDLVATFEVAVRGLPRGWVTISPPQINLNEGQRGTVVVAISAPRRPSSRAGAHFFSLVVTSPDHPGRMSSTSGMVAIQPYYDFAVGELSPRRQTIAWSKRQGEVELPLVNMGNGEAEFSLDAEDEFRRCQFEFHLPGEAADLARHAEVRVAPEDTKTVQMRITPTSRRLVGMGKVTHSYSVTVTPVLTQQTPRTVLGEAQSAPLIGPLPLVLMALLLLILGILIYRPAISDFTVAVAATPPPAEGSATQGVRSLSFADSRLRPRGQEDGESGPIEITAGQEVTLTWEASPFSGLRIEQSAGPSIGPLEGSRGTMTLAPITTTTYTLIGENLLTRVNANWFTARRAKTVVVDPVEPKIDLTVDRLQILSGESVTLSWDVTRAEALLLTVNGAEETILPGEFLGNRTFTLFRDTEFILLAKNAYFPDGVPDSETVRVIVPSPTPPPPPVIQRFDVTPLTITVGDTVTVNWAVSGATTVNIQGIGEVPASGSISAKPDVTTDYVLTAFNGPVQKKSPVQQVIVNPAPTPTPLPGTPIIEFFTATPAEVAIGSPEAKAIQLAWSIAGDTTNVEISGPDFGQASGLDKKGSLTVAANKTTLFILTAFNTTLSASQTVQVKVSSPVPAISGISPGSATAGDADFTLTVNGRNFTSGSIVRWEGANRPTIFVSGTLLKASVAAANIATAGTYRVTVFNPSPGGGTSGVVNFSVTNPSPSISTIAPAQATVGDLGFTLIVTGSGFSSGSKVRWKGADLPTSFVSSAQLAASVSAADLGTAGTAEVTVFNPTPGGGTSNPATFTINAQSPQPAVISIAPSTTVVTTTDLPITVSGSNFSSRAQVKLNGVGLTTTFTSSSSLGAVIPASKLGAPKTYKITVDNPAPCTPGCTSNAVDFPVTLPAPTITGFSIGGAPITGLVAGGPSFTLDINGQDFVSGVVVEWNNSRRTITTFSATQLRVFILSSDIAASGSATVKVTNPDGQSVSRALNIVRPTIRLTPSPTSIPVGSSVAITLRIEDGSGNLAPQAGPRSFQLSTSGGAVGLTSYSSGLCTGTTITSVVTGPVNYDQVTFCAVGLSSVSNAVVTAQTADFGTPAIQATALVTVNNAAPSIASISPNSGLINTAVTPLTITGTGFASGATVQWNGSNTTNTPAVAPTTITVNITAAEVGGSGTKTVTVTNPGPCSGSCTSSTTFTVVNPTPSISSISPSSGSINTAVTPLTITGTGFVSGATVQWNGTNTTNAPTVVSSTQITVNITTAEVGGSNTAKSVTVTNPGTCQSGNCVSNPATFTIDNTAPVITSINPTSGLINTAVAPLTITGTGFVSGATVQWNGTNTALPPTVVSSTQITVDITAGEVGGTSGAKTVTVTNPGTCGGSCVSSSLNYTVNNPAPTITSISPTSGLVTTAVAPLTINGTGFVNGATVQWNGTNTANAPTSVSSTQITVIITAGEVGSPGGARTVTVTNPGTCVGGSCVSNSQNYTVNNPVPTINAGGLSPSSTTAGGAGFTLTVNGTGFVSTSVVRWNGANRATTFVSATQLTASIPASDIASAGTANVTVFNPTPGGGTSGSETFTINNPTPSITSLSPSSGEVNTAVSPLTITGTGFVSGATVQWNGTNTTNAATVVNATTITVNITAAEVGGSTGTRTVTVTNPAPCAAGNCVSNSRTYNVNNPTPSITSISPSSGPANTAVSPLTITGTGFVSGATVQWNGTNTTNAPTVVNSTTITVNITAAEVGGNGNKTVRVTNPSPCTGGSCASNTRNYTVP